MAESVLVVGASRGIGLELVRQYRADGATVVGTARDDAGLARLQALGAHALRIDVTELTSVAGLAWQIDGQAFERVWVNAGVYGPSGLNALQAPGREDFDQVMRTNVLGPMQVVPQLVDALAPQARLGLVTSRMGSIGLRTNGNGWLYRASKAAANSVLRDLAFALEGRAVCAAFHPGWVRTDMGGAGADLSVEQSAAGLRAVLAGLTPADHGHFFDQDGQALAW
ncbi:SDR family oxidoreductase [Ideonella sp. 4Y16]|uniref:SDR family oxidoreductase n=1 Tax=Ideonella alba TaxID=2824118 RepID=A0A941BN68_9BURK|nr:SDR family oxidoreductase [Ideonella alba]MBQ0933004.1 SDR family oxidoreductase [Ideonella alba]MBQ0945751.1 SDR family oxidoreductase [Ideonella alba]